MQITALLDPNAVIARLHAPTRKLVIQTLAHALAKSQRLDPDMVFQAVMERERASGTGIGFGCALPHAQVDGLAAPVIAVARLEYPVNFAALDGVAADLVVMLLTPRHQGVTHLKALACLARYLRRAEVREKLRAAGGMEALLAAFEAPAAATAA
jgi:PTS system nitrogen regulatory IIA component